MSNIKLVHSGGNSVSITTPDSNPAANRTFKLPGADGTSGQALVTDGSGALSFATVNTSSANLLVTRTVNAGPLSGSTAPDFTLPSNCYRVDFVGHNISTSGSGTPAFQVGTTAGMITSGGAYNYTETAYGDSNDGIYRSGDNEIRFGYQNMNGAGDVGEIWASFTSSSASNFWTVIINTHRRTQQGHLIATCPLDLSGNNLTTIRLIAWGTAFDSGRYSFTAYSTS